MKIRVIRFVAMALALAPPTLAAQAGFPDLVGTWEAETPDGPQAITIRADSTASFGDETVRWRVNADTIYILFGDEWVGYNFALEGKALTLWGGDLEEPVTLERIAFASAGSAAPGRPTLRDRRSP
jgi:hypothetical protein